MFVLRPHYLMLLASITPVTSYADVNNKIDFSQRSRIAIVESNDTGKDASILLRLTVNSDWTENIHSKLEIDHVSSFLENERSDGIRFNGKPLIPDAPGTEINQAFVSVKIEDLTLNLGRQRLNFDTQRFIGGNGFWQNEQTFDAIHSRFSFHTNSELTYTYLYNVNRIYGDDAGKYLTPDDINYVSNNGRRPGGFLGDHRHDSHLFHVTLNEWDYSQWTGYAYFIDNITLPTSSNNTLGVSYQFNYKSDVFKYRVQLESALQNRQEFPAVSKIPYYLADAGIGINNIELGSRYEILGSKAGVVFITPLNSAHDFQGWANTFSSIPNHGLEDTSLSLLWRSSPYRIDLHYHLFNEYHGDNNVGTETDLDFVYRPVRRHTFSMRFAYFEPNNNGGKTTADTRKVFFDYTYNM